MPLQPGVADVDGPTVADVDGPTVATVASLADDVGRVSRRRGAAAPPPDAAPRARGPAPGGRHDDRTGRARHRGLKPGASLLALLAPLAGFARPGYSKTIESMMVCALGRRRSKSAAFVSNAMTTVVSPTSTAM